MKYRKTEKWDSIDNSKNLLYFAQLFDELFFDFSLDTYKPSSMNTSLLCWESLEVVDEISNGNIKAPNLQHVIDELCENLSKDKIAHQLISIELRQVNSVLKDPQRSQTEKKTVIELILRQLELKKYKRKTEELLVFAIENDAGFSEIRTLARSYATTLINLGYSTEYIAEVTKKFFYYDKNRIPGNEAINDFVKIFSGKPKEYRLVFRSSDDVLRYEDSLKTFGVSVIHEFEDFDIDLFKYNFASSKNEVLLCLSGIKARDNYSAKNQAEDILEMLSTIFGIFHHKKQFDWSQNCIISNDTDGDVCKSRVCTNAMHKCTDQKPARAALQANQFLSEFGLEKNSFRVFTRAAELHSLALKSDSSENQMLNLWIALESIIPPSTNDKISNIEHIVFSIIPFLNIGYYQRLVARLTSDLFLWNRGVVKIVLEDISGETQVVKVGKLISLPEYFDKRNKLKESFKNFHLLSDRFDFLEQVFKEPGNMLSGLESHKKRVSWQIRRIYRARNMIVHSGVTPSYIDLLIENVHDYLDHIIHKIISYVSDSKKILTIEQAFKLTEMNYSSLESTLSKKGLQFNESMIEEIFRR